MSWHLFANVEMIFYLVSGVVIGILFGILPGLTSTMGMAVFLPFTFGMEPSIGVSFLLGVFFGSVYGGSVTAILVNIPGTPAAIATGLDGYPMGKQGRAGEAIGWATISSCLGGIFGLCVLVLTAPLLASVALKFSAPEYVGFAVLGLAIISYVSSGSMIKGQLRRF